MCNLFSGLAGTFLSLPWVLRYQVKDRGEVKALFPEEIGAIVLRKLRDYAEELACGKVQVSIMFHTTRVPIILYCVLTSRAVKCRLASNTTRPGTFVFTFLILEYICLLSSSSSCPVLRDLSSERIHKRRGRGRQDRRSHGRPQRA